MKNTVLGSGAGVDGTSQSAANWLEIHRGKSIPEVRIAEDLALAVRYQFDEMLL